MIAEALVGGVAEAVIGYLFERGEPPLKERLGLAKDPIKVAFDTALHRAVADTFAKHPDFDGALFHGVFLKSEGAPLLAELLTPDDPLSSERLATTWANRPPLPAPDELQRQVGWIEPICTAFLEKLRHHIRSQPALLPFVQSQDVAVIRTQLEQLNLALPALHRAQTEAIHALNTTLQGLIETPAILRQILSELTRGMWHPAFIHDDTGVQNFLEEYLGHRDQQVPFGGRDKDLQRLTEWLIASDAPQFLLLTAEAGRGKSALLVRWCAALERFSNIEVIFVPISIRFNTASVDVFFSTLGAKLAQVYGDESNFRQLQAQNWHNVCRDYLKRPLPDGKQLVVVIDGLDEATGWEPKGDFMPLSLPDGVRVVVSARVGAGKESAAWRNQLRWTAPGIVRSTTLHPLDRAGVESVLERMGNPLSALVTKVDIVAELFRLTQGDPLLVRLYVNALVAQKERLPTLTAEQLKDIKPGLQGYFDQWWQDQLDQWQVMGRNPLEAQKQVELFFFAVATAFGPVLREDILAILAVDGIGGFQLTGIAKAVGRFVIGDGTERGYTFSHPRLGYYFFDQLSKNEQAAWNDRYVQYGAKCLQAIKVRGVHSWQAGELKAYEYALQHYGEHLERASAAPSDYYALICQEWAQAWEALRGTYDGFLTDLQKTWQIAQHDPDSIQSIKIQVLCALCQSSIATLSTNIPPDLLALAVETKIYSPVQALVLAYQIGNDEQKSEVVASLINQPQIREQVIEGLLDLSLSIRSESNRAYSLIILSQYLPEQLISKAVYQSKTIKNELYLIEVLCSLAKVSHEPYRNQILDEVISKVDLISKVDEKIRVLIILSKCYEDSRKKKYLEQAWNLTQFVERLTWRVFMITEIISQMNPDNFPGIIEDMFEALEDIDDEKVRSDLLSNVITFVNENNLNLVMNIINNFESEHSRAACLCSLAKNYTGREKLAIMQMARESITKVDDNYLIMSCYTSLFGTHANQDYYKKTIEETIAVDGDYNRAFAIRELVKKIPSDLVVLLLDPIAQLDDERHKALALSNIIEYIPESELEGIEILVSKIKNVRHRTSLLMELAKRYSDAKRKELVNAAINESKIIGDVSQKYLLFVSLLPWIQDSVLPKIIDLPKEVKNDDFAMVKIASRVGSVADDVTLPIVLDWASSLTPSNWYPSVLVNIANSYNGVDKEILRKNALDHVRNLSDDKTRVSLLVKLALYHEGSDRYRLLSEVLHEQSKMVEHGSFYYKILSEIASYLPRKLMKKAIISASKITDDYYLYYTLRTLVYYAPKDHLGLIINTSKKIKKSRYRARILGIISRKYEDDNRMNIFREAVSLGYRMRNIYYRLSTLSMLAQICTEKQKFGILDYIWSNLEKVHDPYEKSMVLISLGYNYDGRDQEKVLLQALNTMSAIKEDRKHSEALASISVYLTHTLFYDLLEKIVNFTDLHERSSSLQSIANYVPLFLIQDYFDILYTDNSDHSRLDTIKSIVPRLIINTGTTENSLLIDTWQNYISKIAIHGRRRLLEDLFALMPLTLRILGSEDNVLSKIGIKLPEGSIEHLLILMQNLSLSTENSRIIFLENLGLRSLSEHFDSDLLEEEFVRKFMELAIEDSKTANTKHYLVKLLWYLRNVEWAENVDRKKFIDHLLIMPPISSSQTHLAKEILGVVEKVYLWWP